MRRWALGTRRLFVAALLPFSALPVLAGWGQLAAVVALAAVAGYALPTEPMNAAALLLLPLLPIVLYQVTIGDDLAVVTAFNRSLFSLFSVGIVTHVTAGIVLRSRPVTPAPADGGGSPPPSGTRRSTPI